VLRESSFRGVGERLTGADAGYFPGSELWLASAKDPHYYTWPWEGEASPKKYTYSFDDNLQALNATIETLQANNISVILVSMPLNWDLYEVLGDFQGYLSLIENLSQHYSLPLLVYDQFYRQDAFRNDFAHLNDKGRREFSSQLATDLAPWIS